MKLKKWLNDHFEELLLTICLMLILSVSLLQVIIRRLPDVAALTWAEEFCRFMWIFSVFLSLPYCIKRGNMLTVNIITAKLPDSIKRVFELVIDFITFAVMLILTLASIEVLIARFDSAETSPAMLWPMWVIYAVMLLGYVLAASRAFQQFLRGIKKRGKGI